MVRRLWVFTFLYFSLVDICNAQIDTGQVMPVDPRVKIGRLNNGLTYYIRHNTLPEKRVELRLVVNTGSVMEDDDQLGLAHFVEHMNFNGTKNFPKNQLVSYLQSIGVKFGADLNAYTGFDETIYILPVPTDKPVLIDKGLQILRDWANDATFDPAEIEKERRVIIEEWRLTRGAQERLMKQTLPVQYRGSKYAERLPIGKKEVLENFSHDALKRYYRDWYRPDLQAVIVVGDIDVNDIEQKIRDLFNDIPAPTSPRKREVVAVPDHKESLSVVAKDKETAIPSVEILFKKDVQPESTIGDYSRYMNRRLFTGMLNNRLRELTMKSNPPFVAANSYYGNSLARSKDAFTIYANTSDTGMSRTLQTLMQESRRVLLHGFTQSEFELQKKQIQGQYDLIFNEREKEESYKYVNEYINNFLVGEPIPGIEWEYDFVKQHLAGVKLEDINQLAKKWITNENMVVTLQAPDKPGIHIPSTAEVNKVLRDAEMAAVQPYQDKLIISSLMADTKIKSGKVTSTKENEDLEMTVITLSNGARVILKPTIFKNDEILLRAFSKGGHSLVKDEDYYSAEKAAAIVTQSGVGSLNAVELGNLLKGKNTRLTPYIDLYSEGLNGSTIPKETETLLQLIHLYFTSPRKDKEAFESYKTRQKQIYTNLIADPQVYFVNEFQKTMTRNHPRAAHIPSPDEFDKINLEKSIQIYKERFANAGDFTFFLVGAFEEETIIPLLEKYIGSLPGNNKKENFKDLGIRPPAGKIDKVVSKGSEPKSLVQIIFDTPASYNEKDAHVLQSIADVMNIKLVEKLREEKGSVYGISALSSMQKYPYSYTRFSLYFPCAPENADTITNAAIAELRRIIDYGVTEQDLSKVKEQQKRKLETDMKQNQFWIDALHQAYYLGNDPNNILERRKNIENLDSNTLRETAKKYINPSVYIRGVLKPEKEDKPLKGF